MTLARSFALLLTVLASFAVAACADPTAGSSPTSGDLSEGHSCGPLQAGCSGD